jgi:hypothetical protein
MPSGFPRAGTDISWCLPSQAECLACHTAAAGHSLGLETSQLDMGDQLRRFMKLGIFETLPQHREPW